MVTGLQKQVLGLYRGFMRAARGKAPEERRRMEAIVSAEFRRNAAAVERKNFMYIEYLLRRGARQLDQLKSADTVALSTFTLHRSHSSSDDASSG
ncbi:hypothetical protein Sjap_004769 [Stephania japonica]|uniref:Complex 1 LYR protein domain-containing protein n=1 Tax=Stephania japonica TaxID=461633 RepID=A0AAP0PL74_9MAGN